MFMPYIYLKFKFPCEGESQEKYLRGSRIKVCKIKYDKNEDCQQ